LWSVISQKNNFFALHVARLTRTFLTRVLLEAKNVELTNANPNYDERNFDGVNRSLERFTSQTLPKTITR
jgi:hypothetical protein